MHLAQSALLDQEPPAGGGDDVSSALQNIAAGDVDLGKLVELAGALALSGRLDDARLLYKAWIERNPEDPLLHIALFNGAGLEGQAGDQAAAVQALQRAVSLSPDFAPAHINLGVQLERSGDALNAVQQWTAAVNRPARVTGAAVAHTVTALKQMARVLSEHHQMDAAERALAQCLDLDPRDRQLSEQYIAMRLTQCRWPVVEPREGLDRKALLAGIHPLSLAAYSDDPLFQLAVSERYTRLNYEAGAQDSVTDRRSAPTDVAGRRLRIGYVSSDLRDHAIGYLIAELFEVHDRSRFEVFAYYCGPASSSDLSKRIKAAVEHWVDIRELSADEAARWIAADGIDILVDVNGHTRDARTEVFARRPAPIQVNWLGYPGTMGSPWHQYVIADDWIIPPDHEAYYSEKVLRLPCYQPNDRRRAVASPTPTREEAGLPKDAFVFCCFSGAQKITRFMFDRWLQILKRVPGSVLWLLQPPTDTATRLGDQAEARGIERSRLVFAPKVDSPSHLARHALADLFLDSAPYGAHTTASDALFMGVPILTVSGRSFASRVCGSLVRAAGVPDLVCATPEEYVERAVALGANPAAVEAYKVRLRAAHSSCLLFDTDRLVHALEELYRHMCAEHQAGRTPRPDLSNLDAYFQAGLAHEHEADELLGRQDYLGLYRSQLARIHRVRPMQADQRAWTAAAIAEVDASVDARAAANHAEAGAAHRAKRSTTKRNSQMTMLTRLHEIYRSAGLQPLTGHSTKHMHDWADAPFTRFYNGEGIVGCAGLSLFEIMFLEHLGNYVDPRSVLVIGNAHGWSTIALALIFPKAQVLALDPFQEGVELTNELARRNKLSVNAVVGTSPGSVKPACAEHLNSPVDFVLIDAIHTNEAVKTDFFAAAEVAGKDAFYLFHDVINWKMVEGFKDMQSASGLGGRILTRTPSGMAVLHGEISPDLVQYLECFSDNTQLLTAYRSMVQRAFAGDVLGEALASL
jgi:predicted O-linked N-acetylglucosamine transferase (SPINDLY family)